MLQQDPEHPCRVCLAEGARNIFNTNTINDERCTVASLNHIRQKLQYVTQLQVNEDDGLPFWICELCVVQLNVAYRFKVLASESDNALRQRLKDVEESSQVPNALARPRTNFNGVVERRAIKQERPNEIAGPGPVTPKHYPSNPSPAALAISQEAANELLSSVSSDADSLPAMVCLQKDLFDPAEDEAFLQDILKGEVIAMPWEIINEAGSSNEKKSPTPTVQPPSNAPSTDNGGEGSTSTPKQSVAKKRKRSVTENRQTSKKFKTKQPGTVGKVAVASTSTDKQSTPKDNTKTLSKAALRRLRLKKVLEKLRIDMIDDKLIDRCAFTANVQPTPLPKAPMKRRNSVCVSSFSQFL